MLFRSYCGGDDYISGLVSFAENFSELTCETCGKVDFSVGRNTKGWIKTTCEEHKTSENFNFNYPELKNI